MSEEHVFFSEGCDKESDVKFDFIELEIEVSAVGNLSSNVLGSICVPGCDGFLEFSDCKSVFIDEAPVDEILFCSRIDKGLYREFLFDGLVIALTDRKGDMQ